MDRRDPARGTSVVVGHMERLLINIKVSNLHVRMLAENIPDKRATDGFVFQYTEYLTLHDVQLQWHPETRRSCAEGREKQRKRVCLPS